MKLPVSVCLLFIISIEAAPNPNYWSNLLPYPPSYLPPFYNRGEPDPNCNCKGWDDGCWWGGRCDIHCHVDCPDKQQVAPNRCTSSVACGFGRGRCDIHCHVDCPDKQQVAPN